MKSKKLAIITPVYNTKSYLREFITSILNQSFEDFDLFFVDDGSTDGSGDLIKDYTKNDVRFFYYKKNNGGVSSARNYALKNILNSKTTYKYIYFCDSDDILGNDLLLKVISAMDCYSADYSVFSVSYLYKNYVRCRKPSQKNIN